jgi:hypothetical protein
VIILIWELIPTSVVIILFRLRVNLFQSCYNNNNNNNRFNANIQSTISVFLDNEANNEILSDDDDDYEQAFNNYYNRTDPVSYQSSKHLINSNYY